MPASAKSTLISDEVLAVLSQMTFNGNVAYLPDRVLERKLYVDVNKVLESLGGKWKKKPVNGHVFESEAEPLIESALLTKEYTKPGDMGWFPTPEPIVDKLLQLAELYAYMRVLEPSAGLGAIAKVAHRMSAKSIDVVELDGKRADTLRNEFSVTCADFLTLPPKQEYDRVIMNPPFAPAQADIDHVLHAFKFLKSGGRVVAVMAAGVKFRDNKKTVAFREFVKNNNGRIHDLPEDAFKDSGTNVKTVVVVINKE